MAYGLKLEQRQTLFVASLFTTSVSTKKTFYLVSQLYICTDIFPPIVSSHTPPSRSSLSPIVAHTDISYLHTHCNSQNSIPGWLFDTGKSFGHRSTEGQRTPQHSPPEALCIINIITQLACTLHAAFDPHKPRVTSQSRKISQILIVINDVKVSDIILY